MAQHLPSARPGISSNAGRAEAFPGRGKEPVSLRHAPRVLLACPHRQSPSCTAAAPCALRGHFLSERKHERGAGGAGAGPESSAPRTHPCSRRCPGARDASRAMGNVASTSVRLHPHGAGAAPAPMPHAGTAPAMPSSPSRSLQRRGHSHPAPPGRAGSRPEMFQSIFFFVKKVQKSNGSCGGIFSKCQHNLCYITAKCDNLNAWLLNVSGTGF